MRKVKENGKICIGVPIEACITLETTVFHSLAPSISPSMIGTSQMSKRGENIYKRKDGRWEGRYIKCRTLQGKIQYGYVYGKSYSEAKAKLKENASTPIRASTNQMAQFTLYGEILKVWLLSAKNRVKESTISRYNHIVQRHIQPFLGNYQISEIGAALLEEYIDYLLQHGRLDGSGGLSPKSVADIIVVIKSSMRYAQENGYRINCSTTGLSVKRSKKDMRVLSKKEQQQLECVLMQDTDLTKFMVLLCLYTGIRIGEACALRWKHIRLDSGILEVRETMQRIQAPQNIAAKTRVIITEPKSACSKRDIPLPKFLIQYAAQFQTERKAFVLTGETDQFIEPRTLQNRFRNYVKASGIEHANYHALRHTFATRCVELGFEIKSLSEILGHSNVNITLNKYVHSSIELKKQNMEKLNPAMIE